MIEAGLREAGTLDQEKLRDAFARVKIDSPLGAHEAGKDNMQMAGAMVSIFPVLVLFFLFQKQIVQSLATSGLKEE